MKIGDKVIIIHTGYIGTIITQPEIILGTKHYGIKFDEAELNKLFNPYYITENLLEKI